MKGFDRVLLGVDFSIASKRAMHLAGSLISNNACIYAIHVVPDIATKAKDYVKDPAAKELQKRITEEAMNQLTSWADKNLNVSCKLECVIASGDPSNEIIKAARSKGVQLIVIGIHGQRRSNLGHVGSNLEKVVQESECPVICVPAERV